VLALADGIEVVDGDWDAHNGHYRVRLASGWTVVPDQAVVPGPNNYQKTAFCQVAACDELTIERFGTEHEPLHPQKRSLIRAIH
jgi:hypothetical protein